MYTSVCLVCALKDWDHVPPSHVTFYMTQQYRATATGLVVTVSTPVYSRLIFESQFLYRHMP